MTAGVGVDGLGQVEHPLEFSVIGIVSLVSLGDQIKITSSLVYFTQIVLSAPKSSDLAFCSPHQTATMQSPKTPPRYLPDRLKLRVKALIFSISCELYFSSCWRVILLGSGSELGLETNFAKGLSCDITILLSSIQHMLSLSRNKTTHHLRALVLFFVVALPRNMLPPPFFTLMSSSTFLDKFLSFSSTLPSLSSRTMLFPSFFTVLFS